MAIIPDYDMTSKADVSPTGGFNSTANINSVEVSSSSNGYNKALTAIEVVFSLLVVMIMMFCFSAGLRKKRSLRKQKAEMVENAVIQQEQRLQALLQGGSTGTVTTLLQLPPPCYYPPDPATQLSSAAISRLDQLMLENQLCTLPSGVTLPKYTDLYRANNVT